MEAIHQTGAQEKGAQKPVAERAAKN
jgi:hypothetical protein